MLKVAHAWPGKQSFEFDPIYPLTRFRPWYPILIRGYVNKNCLATSKSYHTSRKPSTVTRNHYHWPVSSFGFYDALTSQIISVAFYSEREKSDKFWSEALISAWGSFTFRKSTTRDPRLYLPSEENKLGLLCRTVN